MRQPTRLSRRYGMILPATLLVQQDRWQSVAATLPRETYLVVLDARHARQSGFLRQLARALQQKGKAVHILSVGLDTPTHCFQAEKSSGQ